MKEVAANLWSFQSSGIIVVTTNGFVKKDGSCVMGRGCAREAAIKFPQLPFELGSRIRDTGNHCYNFPQYKLISFPVKHVWMQDADLALIERSAHELVELHATQPLRFYLPRPGCGNGGLYWSAVKPVLEPILQTDDYTVVHYPEGER